jgi:DNA mismatch repair protein MutL
MLNINAGDIDDNSRISQILGHEFANNSNYFSNFSEDFKIEGFIGLPTYNKSNAYEQFIFVNKRIVKDKLMSLAVKLAYQNLIPHGRYPALVLFFELDPYDVDVNVHPAKSEVRFKDPEKVKSFIIHSIRNNLQKFNSTAPIISENIANDLIFKTANTNTFKNQFKPSNTQSNIHLNSYTSTLPQKSFDAELNESTRQAFIAPITLQPEAHITTNSLIEPKNISDTFPLGFAKAQIDNMYILSENEKGLIIVDQHAAHERITLEKLKANIFASEVRNQYLLVPQIIELGEKLLNSLLSHQSEIEKYGFIIEKNGLTQILVRAIPQFIDSNETKEIITEMAEYSFENGSIEIGKEKLIFILGNHACKNSIKAGKKMSLEEMNHLLRQIEQTPLSSQCNHGRPVYIELKSSDLARFFERH